MRMRPANYPQPQHSTGTRPGNLGSTCCVNQACSILLAEHPHALLTGAHHPVSDWNVQVVGGPCIGLASVLVDVGQAGLPAQSGGTTSGTCTGVERATAPSVAGRAPPLFHSADLAALILHSASLHSSAAHSLEHPGNRPVLRGAVASNHKLLLFQAEVGSGQHRWSVLRDVGCALQHDDGDVVIQSVRVVRWMPRGALWVAAGGGRRSGKQSGETRVARERTHCRELTNGLRAAATNQQPDPTCTAIFWYVPAESDQLSMPIVTCVGAPQLSSRHCTHQGGGALVQHGTTRCRVPGLSKKGAMAARVCPGPRNVRLTWAAVITMRELTSVAPHMNQVPSLRTHHLQREQYEQRIRCRVVMSMLTSRSFALSPDPPGYMPVRLRRSRSRRHAQQQQEPLLPAPSSRDGCIRVLGAAGNCVAVGHCCCGAVGWGICADRLHGRHASRDGAER